MEVASDLCHYLEALLPRLSEQWWTELVVRVLSFQQQRAVEQRKITALSGLDIAALLRVLDQNWYAIAAIKNPPAEARHYVKEMRSVRDRWAHASIDAFSQDDIYRDLDTIQRFAMIIDAEDTFIEKIRGLKAEVLLPPSPPRVTSPAPTVPLTPSLNLRQSVGESPRPPLLQNRA